MAYDLNDGTTYEISEVRENTFIPLPVLRGRPELLMFSGGDGWISGTEPRVPIEGSYRYIKDWTTGVERRVTLKEGVPASGGLVRASDGSYIFVYLDFSGSVGCYYYKNLTESGIMDESGRLLLSPTE